MEILPLLFSSLVVMFASLIGVFFAWRGAGKLIERHLTLLVSFSAGVFAVIAWELGSETIELSASALSGFLWIGTGAFVFWLVFKIVPAFHHHHEGRECKNCPHSVIDARRILAGDALHNMGDGILLAASFVVTPALGWFTAASIFIHELVQEISEFFVLRQAGYSAKRALGINFLTSSTILIGAIGGFLLLETFETIEIALLGISSGAFLIVVLHDLVPHSVRVSRKKGAYFPHLAWFVAGIALMLFLNIFTGH